MMDLCKHCSDMMGGSWPMLGSKCTCGNRALPSAEQCEHGHLARKCEVCMREGDIKELRADVARLRSACREAADELAGLRGIFVSKSKYPRTHEKVTALVEMLEQAGKEATDGK